MPICDAQLWLLVSVTLVAIVTFFIYRPLPDGIKEPWKARQAIAVIDAIAKIVSIKYISLFKCFDDLNSSF